MKDMLLLACDLVNTNHSLKIDGAKFYDKKIINLPTKSNNYNLLASKLNILNNWENAIDILQDAHISIVEESQNRQSGIKWLRDKTFNCTHALTSSTHRFPE